jgi:hypothetical protein
MIQLSSLGMKELFKLVRLPLKIHLGCRLSVFFLLEVKIDSISEVIMRVEKQ